MNKKIKYYTLFSICIVCMTSCATKLSLTEYIKSDLHPQRGYVIFNLYKDSKYDDYCVYTFISAKGDTIENLKTFKRPFINGGAPVQTYYGCKFPFWYDGDTLSDHYLPHGYICFDSIILEDLFVYETCTAKIIFCKSPKFNNQKCNDIFGVRYKFLSNNNGKRQWIIADEYLPVCYFDLIKSIKKKNTEIKINIYSNPIDKSIGLPQIDKEFLNN